MRDRKHQQSKFLHWWISEVALYLGVTVYALLNGSLSGCGVFEVFVACFAGFLGGYIFFRTSRPYFKEGFIDYDSMSAKKRTVFFLPFLVVSLLLMSLYLGGGNRLLAGLMAILFLTFSGYVAIAIVCFERRNHLRIYSKHPAGVSIELVFINGFIWVMILGLI